MNATHKTLTDAIARELETLIKLYDFSEAATVALLSESENKVYLVTDTMRPKKYVIRVNSGRLTYHTPTSIASELMWMTGAAIERALTKSSKIIERFGKEWPTVSPEPDRPYNPSTSANPQRLSLKASGEFSALP